jgi:hypothetical protein
MKSAISSLFACVLAFAGMANSSAVAASVGVRSAEINAVVYATADAAPQNATWQRVETTYQEDGVTVNVWYKADPGNFMVVKFDTELFARAVLKELVNLGFQPADEYIHVMVNGEQHVTGETGRQGVAWYGFTMYDSYSDALEFTQCTPGAFLGC